MTTLKPIKNNIIFSFVDRVNSQGQFEKEATSTGIILQASMDDSAKSPRWGRVEFAGPECTVTPGMYVLLPNLRWTSSFTVDGKKMWKTDETQVVATKQTISGDLTVINKYVVFTKVVKPRTTTVLGIEVVGGDTDTASGVVVDVGNAVEHNLVQSTIYYNDVNFSDTFTHGGCALSFIKESEIIAYMRGE